MASHFMPYNAHELAELLAPASATDAAALIAVGLASTAYLLRGIAWDRPDPYQHIWFERPQLQDGATTRQPKATRNIAEKLDEAVCPLKYPQSSFPAFDC
jgi:NADPH-ferrihemoprotein reductase